MACHTWNVIMQNENHCIKEISLMCLHRSCWHFCPQFSPRFVPNDCTGDKKGKIGNTNWG